MANGGDRLTLFVPADEEDAGEDGGVQQTSGGLMQWLSGGLADVGGGLLRFGLVAVVLTLIIQGCMPKAVVNVAPTTLHCVQLNGDYAEKEFTVWNTGGRPLRFTYEIAAADNWITIVDVVAAQAMVDGNYVSDPPDAAGVTDKVVFTVGLVAADVPADAEGAITIKSNGGADVAITVTTAPDYNTQEFTAQKPFNLQNQTVTFTPTATDYDAAVTESGEDFNVLPDPAGEIDFGADDVVPVAVAGGEKVPFFGVDYDQYWVAADGFVSLADPAVGDADALVDHFSTPRITGLSGLDAKAGAAAVYAQQTAEGAFVTYEDVPLATAKQSQDASFQIQMLFDGTIVVTYLNMPASAAVIGLSPGGGIPIDFVSTDFTTGPLKAAF